MNYVEFVEQSVNLDKFPDRLSPREERLILGAFGIMDEAGEVGGMIKKYFFHGDDFDRDAFILELGDVFWYLTLLASTVDVGIKEIMNQNKAKLEARHGVRGS